MVHAKNRQKPKSYWQILIQEITTSPPRPSPTKGFAYNTQYERRNVKYTLNEPLTSVYFTQREAECVMQLLQGKTMNQTGEALNLSPRTIEYYLGKIKRKLNCRKKRDIIKLVSQTDFVENFKQDPYNNKSS